MTTDRIREHRSVELCSDSDALHGERDRSRLWAYGYAGIAELAGCPVEAVRDAVTRKRFDPGDLLDVARWVQARQDARGILHGDRNADVERGGNALAAAVRRSLGHPTGCGSSDCDDKGQP
jgi:hypothetical protein